MQARAYIWVDPHDTARLSQSHLVELWKMATETKITRVWIEEGCIVCDLCETTAPAVFDVQEETCIVREDADLSGGAAIIQAAEECPVDVIKFETA